MKINKWYWIFCFLIIATIFIYGKFRCMYPKYKDILVPQYIKGIDGWSLTHFCTFSVLGTLYPDTFLLSFILGISWEMFEILLGIIKPNFLKGITDCHREYSGNSYLSNDQKNGYWWYGKWQDIIFNTIGFLFGKYIIRNFVQISPVLPGLKKILNSYILLFFIFVLYSTGLRLLSASRAQLGRPYTSPKNSFSI